jgi:hypothetical protein
VLHFKQLKETIRKLPKDVAATPAQLSRLEEVAIA